MLDMKRIKELIKEQGYTLASFEKAVGFGNATISRWEKAHRQSTKFIS